MPLYEYENEQTGEKIESFRQVTQRDQAPKAGFRRVMSRTSCKMGEGITDPTNADVAAPRGLKEMEQQMGTSKLEREMGMSAKKLKKIWNVN
jgi:hypothetical protein